MDDMTTPDPLETTAPDRLEPRRSRLSPRRRRMVEAGVLVVLGSAFLTVRWFDDVNQASASWARPEKVSVVRRGATGVLGRSQWRMLGRDATAPPRSSITPAGAVDLTFLLEVRTSDAQGAKDAQRASYRVRDRQGHIWSAFGAFTGGKDPVAGVTTRVTVTTELPAKVASTVVLEVRGDPAIGAKGSGPLRVLRFAH